MKKLLLLLIASSCASLMGMQMKDIAPQDITIENQSDKKLLQEKESEQDTESRCKKLLMLCSLKTCLSSKPSCSVNQALENGDDCCNVLGKYLMTGYQASGICPAFVDHCIIPPVVFCADYCCNPIAKYGPEYLKQASLGALLSIWRVAACGIDLACLPLACLGRPCKNFSIDQYGSSAVQDPTKLKANRNDAFCYCTRTILIDEAYDMIGRSDQKCHKDAFSCCTRPFLSDPWVSGQRLKVKYCNIPITLGTSSHSECCDWDTCCAYPSLCY